MTNKSETRSKPSIFEILTKPSISQNLRRIYSFLSTVNKKKTPQELNIMWANFESKEKNEKSISKSDKKSFSTQDFAKDILNFEK